MLAHQSTSPLHYRSRPPVGAQPEREEHLTLAALPTDVLEAIVLQILGSAELCAMEGTCWLLHSLIDDRAWQQCFFQRRRGTVLTQPDCWKKEMMRRDMWSRDWRKILGCHCPGRLRLSQRLRNMINLNAMTRKHDTIVVDARGAAGTCTTISAALAQAKAYDVVMVLPGEYNDNLRISEHVEIVGAGPTGSIVLSATDGPVIEVSGRVSCRVANLVVRQVSRATSGAMSSAVLVKGGASFAIEESVVSSDIGHCIVIQGVGSCGHVLHNAVSNGKGVGVLVCDHARGVIEDNDIARSGRAGVAILNGGDPVVSHNRIRDGMDSGVLVSEKGRGRVADNDICSNRRAGVAILKEGAPLVQRNRIHGGRDSGVLVCENGQGSVVENEIFANQVAGVAIGRGGASRVTGNTIRDGSGGSLCLSQHSKGTIAANVIHQHTSAAMQVPEDLIVEVQSLNEIHYESADAAEHIKDDRYAC